MLPPVVVIVGATATGKSALAVELAVRADGEVINADARQLYRGLDIGTGKPTQAERARAPHHLFDVLAPDERASAGWYARSAAPLVAAARARGRLPIVVGGTGFYVRALLRGLPEIPPVAAEVEERLAAELAAGGLEALRARLERADPVLAARLAAGDRQRILRGLAVFEQTGRPLSAWQAGVSRPLAGPILWLGLAWPPAEQRQRIAQRVEAMLAAGWVDEVRGLLAAGVDPTGPAFEALGYREVAAHLAGALAGDRLRQVIVDATCRYAKRQRTWFRAERAVVWLPAADPAGALRCSRELLAALRAG